MIRVKAKRDFPLLDRVIELAGVVQGDAVIEMRVGEVRLERDRFLKQRERFAVFAGAVEHQAQIAVRLGVVGIVANRVLIRGDGFVQSAQRAIRFAEIVIRIAAHAKLDGVVDPLHGGVGSPHLMRQHTEQMPRRRVLLIGGENLPIDLLRLLKLPRLVRRQRLLQKLVGVDLLHVASKLTARGAPINH